MAYGFFAWRGRTPIAALALAFELFAPGAAFAGGTAAAWGLNGSGALGDNSLTLRPAPVSVVSNVALINTTVTQISAGDFHSCAVASDGAAYCWGDNISGQLGDNSTKLSPQPVAVDMSGALAGKTVIQISAGGTHSCAVTLDGGAYCWGDNSFGQLGDGTTTSRVAPVAVVTSGALSGKTVTQISAGYEHTCALTSDGGAYCWGDNFGGQLGDGTTTSRVAPVAVVTSGALAGKKINQIDTGSYIHSCALTSDGGVYCWGDNKSGQLGDNTTTGRNVPVAVNASERWPARR